MRVWWGCLGLMLGAVACSFAWDDLDPRASQSSGAGGTGGLTGSGGTGGEGGQTTAGGAGGTGGEPPDPCESCPTTCSDTFSESFADPPAGWTLNGDASHDATTGSVVLTPPQTSRAGTVFRNAPIAVDAFTATFEVRVSDTPVNTGGGPTLYGAGDGMAFVLQTDGPSALGDSGGALGVSPLNGFGVELDTYENSIMCLEPSFEHVGLNDLATICGLDGNDSVPTTLAASDVLPGDLAEGGWRSVTVDVDAGMVTVSLDDTAVLGPVALPGFASGSAHYLGFGAGTGGAFNRHEVRNLVVTFPTPRCL